MVIASNLVRKINRLFVGCIVMWLVPTIANSAPIVFSFDMPYFGTGSGTYNATDATSILEVHADNGSNSLANQSYLNTDIFGYYVTVLGFGEGGALPGDINYRAFYQGSQIYITTDGTGIPTLDLSAQASSYATFQSNGPDVQTNGANIQLGTRIGTSGAFKYSASVTNTANGRIGNRSIVVVGSSSAVPPVAISAPAPISLFLLAGGILGIRTWYRQPEKHSR